MTHGDLSNAEIKNLTMNCSYQAELRRLCTSFHIHSGFLDCATVELNNQKLLNALSLSVYGQLNSSRL